MELKQKTTFDTEFENEVYEGLTAFPKYLSSKYFYDKIGDKLFQNIMALPEYYLTGCEYDIIDQHKDELLSLFKAQDGFDLIELGAGDGKKTKILLQHLYENNVKFSYKPIDISHDVLEELECSVKEIWPELPITTQQGTYFKVLDELNSYSNRKKVILVLGSNIGNLSHPQAIDFLRNIQRSMDADDLLFMGFDQKKSPDIILAAYNDSKGTTEAFNKNILTRINREMDANFNPDNFMHWPTYDPENGTAKSFLVSTKSQEVNLNKLDLSVSFEAWESIHTEISQKYDDSIVEWLAREAHLELTDQFSDEKGYFTDYIFRKNKI